MKRALLVLVLASSCLDFERRVSNCFDGGVCTSAVDAGANSNDGGLVDAGPPRPFVPLDAGFFCAGAFCWESPFPHGVTLNAVFADGDDLVVAGEFGMVAERRDGGWRSLQPAFGTSVNWTGLWGTSRDDVWLAGGPNAWHRTPSGWGIVGGTFTNADSRAVTGSDAGVFMSAGSAVHRLEGDVWMEHQVLPGDVLQLANFFGEPHASVRGPSNVTGRVTNLASGVTWSFDAGATYGLIPTASALYATGSLTVQLDGTLMPVRELPDVMVAGIETGGQLFAATYGTIGRVIDGGVRVERSLVGVRAMAAGRTVVAVGSNGLVFERASGGSWEDATPTVSHEDVRAFVELDGGLFALTSACELLERREAGWSKHLLSVPSPCADVASDGTSLFVLAGTSMVTMNASLGVVRTDTLGAELRRVWRSDSGALVVTSSTDIFVQQPGGELGPMRSAPGAGKGSWGVSGRGSVARVCGLTQGQVVDLDLSRTPPVATAVQGVLANECHAVLPLRNGGWALASRGGGDKPHVLLVRASGQLETVVLELPATYIEALVETPVRLFVASDRVASFEVGSPQTTIELPPGFGGITALTVWRGRLFVGGLGGSILQAPAP